MEGLTRRAGDRATGSASLQTTLEQSDDLWVLKLSGSAGVSEGDRIEAAVRPVLARRPRRLVVDVSGLTHMSSLAIGVLVQTRNALVRHGGQVGLFPGTGMIRDLLIRTGMERLFIVGATLDQVRALLDEAGASEKCLMSD